jgi:hypothetical protein
MQLRHPRPYAFFEIAELREERVEARHFDLGQGVEELRRLFIVARRVTGA